MYRFTIIVVCFAILSCLTGASRAEIPKLINYQGMLTDDGGTPLNETVSITFKIYSDSLSVSEIDKKWEETQTGIEVVNGLFNVILGRDTALDLDFSEDYWLDITVGTEHLPGRVRLTSVGWAYRAMVADSASVAVSAPTGGGWTDDGTVVRLASGTDSVGIGTGDPAEKLHVNGDIRLNLGSDVAFGGDATRVYGSSGDLRITADDDIYLQPDDDVYIRADGGSDWIRFDPGGQKLGIGTTNPHSGLQVNGSQASAFKLIDYTDTPYYVTDSDCVIAADGSGGHVHVYLPTAVGIAGRIYTFKIIAKFVSIHAAGSETMDGVNAIQPGANVSLSIISDGSNWLILTFGAPW